MDEMDVADVCINDVSEQGLKSCPSQSREYATTVQSTF